MHPPSRTTTALFALIALTGCGSRGPIYDDPWFGRDASLGSTDASADAPARCEWEPAVEGLSGGGIGALTIDPTDAARRTLYGLSGQRVYRTTDGGDAWTLRGEIDASPNGLAFDGATLLVSTDDGIRASSDGGVTFEARGLRGLVVTSLATSIAVPNRVYGVVAGLGVARSNDGGTSWSAARLGIEGAVHRLSVDPRDADRVVAGTILLDAAGSWTADGEMLITTNGGQSWTEIDRTGGRTYDLARCADDPSVLIAVRRWGIFRSTDGGASFVAMAGAADQVFFSAAVDGASCTHVVAFSNTPNEGFGMYVADDGSHFAGPFTEGFTMSRSARSDPDVRSIGGGRIVTGTVSGPYVSDDAGRTYRGGGGFLSMPVTTLVQSEGVLWVGTYGNGLWSLAPGDTRWERLPVEQLDNDYTFGLFPMAGATVRSGPVIVGSWGQLVSRTAGSSRFEVVPNDGSPADNVFGITRLADGTLLTASQVEGVQRSEDAGMTFRDSNTGFVPWPTPLGVIVDLRSIAYDPSRSVVVVGGEGGGAWRSVDAGRTWMAAGLEREAVRTLVHVPALGTVTALVAGDGVYESEGGMGWVAINDGLTSLDVDGVAADDDGTRYVASGGRVYRRGPVATRWELMPGACGPLDARRLQIAVRADGTWLYAVTGLDGFTRIRIR